MKRAVHSFAIVAALLFGGLFGAPARAATPLVDAAWVKANIGKPGIVVLDARSDRKAYDAGHIPGAVFTDYAKGGWRTKMKDVPGMLPDAAGLEKLIGSLGIGNDSHVIVVAPGNAAQDMGIATRIYWTFKVAGHDEVSILSGGMRAYLADKSNPVDKAAVTPTPRPFKVSFRPELMATADDVKKALADGKTALIDNRPPKEFSGAHKSKSVVRYGTVPGAASVPAMAMTEKDSGVFKSGDALKALYEQAGAKPGDDEIAFCNTGHWASIGWFVSHELLGNGKARLYDGSMADWSRDDKNPMLARVPPEPEKKAPRKK